MIHPTLWTENIEDAHTLARRLATRRCPITRSKLNRLLRDGGSIEQTLAIHASATIVAATPGGLDALRTTATAGAWWTTRDRLLATIPLPSRWEHVTPVKTAIEETIAASHLDPTAFATWFATAVTTRWEICLITRGEDARLGTRDPSTPWAAYDTAGIQRAGLVRPPLTPQGPLEAP